MEHPGNDVRSEFVKIVDGWVIRLRDTRSGLPSDRSGDYRRVATLGHRLSDTLPSDLAEQLEEIVDEVLTLSQAVWPGRPGDASLATTDADLLDRLERLGRRWSRFKPNLLPD